MNDRFAGIVEVATASKARVNLFLEAGYRLLAIKQQAIWTSPPKGTQIHVWEALISCPQFEKMRALKVFGYRKVDQARGGAIRHDRHSLPADRPEFIRF